MSEQRTPFVDRGQAPDDSAGRAIGLGGVDVDVTERSRAEEALRQSEARFRTLFETMSEGFSLNEIICDDQGKPCDLRFLDVNPAFERHTGLRAADILGRTTRELFPDAEPEWFERYGKVALTGEPVHFEAQFGPLGKWFEVRAYRTEPPRFAVVFFDITERKRAEEDLVIVTRLYAVLSRVNEAIVRIRDEQLLYEEVCRIVAEEGGFPLVWVGLVSRREVAPAASWGCATEYLRDIKVEVEGELGQGPTGTCVREDRPVINDDFEVNPSTWPWRQATLRQGLRASAAFPLHRGGTVIGALTLYAAKPGAFTTKQVKLLEALCADITYALDGMQQERLRTEAERALRESEHSLREADQRKDEFLGMLSHELRNPLAPIRNSVYILRHASPGSEQAQHARSVIERQTEHLTRLVDDLLDVTRIARGKIAMRRSRVDLRVVVRRAADDFWQMLNERGIAFRTALPQENVWAEADTTRITQVIGNLLHNAAKFTRRGDEVALALRVEGEHAEISVRDTGAGIDPALLPRIFDAFVQGDRTLARADGGLGLGLALVKGITELHGGKVVAESAGKGRGTEFIVRLPTLGPEPAQEMLRAGTPRAGRRRRVLVVDDNRDAAESLAQILEMLGHDAEVAYDGATAVANVRASPPDVLLCDVGLPGMSGYEVAKALRASGVLGVQLIAVTGYAQPEDVSAALEAGFDRHLAKPASPEDIERLLAT